jgi:GntR family transcriptional regulator
MTRRRKGPRRLDRASRTPLWQQLHDELVARLEGGEFADRFPGELELMEAYAVSRHTVRESLRQLRREGVIQSSRGRSSVVNPGLISQDLGAMYSLFHELESRGIEQRSEVQVVELRQDAVAAGRLGLPDDREVVYIERLRLADEEPIAWDFAWLDPDLAAPLLGADLTHSALYDEWHRATGVRLTGGRETIRAVLPTSGQRTRLAMDDDEAALLVERVGLAGDRPVEYRRTLVRGSRFSVTAEWSSASTYQVDISARG